MTYLRILALVISGCVITLAATVNAILGDRLNSCRQVNTLTRYANFFASISPSLLLFGSVPAIFWKLAVLYTSRSRRCQWLCSMLFPVVCFSTPCVSVCGCADAACDVANTFFDTGWLLVTRSYEKKKKSHLQTAAKWAKRQHFCFIRAVWHASVPDGVDCIGC